MMIERFCRLAFFQEFFQGGIYCNANFFCYDNFLLFSDQILGGRLLEGGASCPPWRKASRTCWNEKDRPVGFLCKVGQKAKVLIAFLPADLS